MLLHETRALLARLALVKPFALQEPMLPAAALLPAAEVAIDRFLLAGRRELRLMVGRYLAWLNAAGDEVSAEEAQRRFAVLRLKFNAVLTQFDTFADVITQRSENESGVWLSGLDVVAAEALALPGYYDPPPVICYLDRDIGAAIRRARTRMPGGGESPVAIIRVPRERMVGTSIASSLVHEVGHQAAALLDLVNSLRPALWRLQRGAGAARRAWQLWERWISEIVADFWSVARVGIASTLGLIGVVSLPRAFVFRLNADDPHPMPWIRVKLSAAIGDALYPHPQWQRLSATWESFYPPDGVAAEMQALLQELQATMPAFAAALINHRPPALRGRSLAEVMDTGARQPARLAALFRSWQAQPSEMYRAKPTLVFAVMGQARSDGKLSPEDESLLLCKLLAFWALRATLDMSEICAAAPVARARAA
ncbi:hypothetical protein [Bradyrhizobium sp. CCBAU 25338]|uniref:hypothetical protein n=1 Tax=Bradyrhizobium sp. CCBAU 25338 TaxID=1641877 RepID=UPI00230499F8|nr:hypothetical protein [Bradyrhizobium sp. CCBAU 25338]MDA9528726.1 hypothetical protein [Bradyrhizobium sp. CCBAU 25338]